MFQRSDESLADRVDPLPQIQLHHEIQLTGHLGLVFDVREVSTKDRDLCLLVDVTQFSGNRRKLFI
jgi:hypothetical protein